MKQAHILYSGHVQGVGFRYTVRKFCTRLNLTGWARNLANGSVETVIEGSESTIQQACRQIEDYFAGHIRDKEITFRDVDTQQHEGFDIII